MTLLTKAEVLAELTKRDILGEGRIMFKVLDYSENPFAPEKFAYRVHYTNHLGQRKKVTYYPKSVGFQWS